MSWMVAIAIAALPACSFRSAAGTPADADPDARADAPIDGAPGDAPGEWWDPLWTHRRQITIQNTELTGPVQNFPLLVRLPAGLSTNQLRFLAADHRTILPHELDTASGSGALVWVRIPDLSNTGPAPVLWVYYGNAAAQSTSSGAAVFGDLFVSVHHLGSSQNDSTGHNHTADSTGNERPNQVPGQIGDARDFDGVNDHLDLTDETAYDFTASLSASAWIRRQDFGTVPYMAIITKGDKTWRVQREDLTQFANFGTTAGGTNDNLAGSVSIDDASWHHVAIAFGAAKKRLFIDGRQDGMSNVGATIDTNDRVVTFGQNEESTTGGKRFWNGDLDEIRISAAARDGSWMFAEHHTVTDADFVQVGADEPYRP